MSSTSPKDIKSFTKQSLVDERFPNNQQANQVNPNYDFNDNSVPTVIEGRKSRNRNRCLFCCTPKVLMIISVIYLIIGTIHTVTQLEVVFGCRDLYRNLDSTTPSTFSFDQNTIPTLNVKVSAYFNRYDELWISQTNDALTTNTTVQIRMATRNSNSQFETNYTPGAYNLNLSKGNAFENFLSLWAFKCAVSRVEVILPQQVDVTTTSSPININSEGLDIKFKQNSILYPYMINLKTTSSDIDIENILTTDAKIQTTSGDIKGSISSLQNGINIESTNGDINVKANTNTIGVINPKIGLKSTSGNIDLELNVSNNVVNPIVDVSATSGDINTDINLANGITDSQITIEATSGDVDLKLHDTFEGQYQITTTSGDVNVGIGNNKNHNRQGRIGSVNSQGSLKIGVTSGDVNVEFS
ncbi:hypothetical protein C1645_829018 [Glomus cerebriforme]|uniref:DUF4097 domain-containing protein n=1 Tax=Glomus cerebriforme TaxID=658196 RepID=A0A397SK87_9GLOM|nr:hypothetical protein C1645_829018 [Glomus cerebriforme]